METDTEAVLGKRISEAIRHLDAALDAVAEAGFEVRLFLLPRGIHLTRVGARLYHREPNWQSEHVMWIDMPIPEDEDD